jgi:hypothetical protein
MMGTQRDLALSWSTRRILQWGVLWGLLLSAAEFFVNLPVHGMPLPAFLLWWLTVWPLPLWCLLGSVMLLLARRAERSGHWRAPFLFGLAAALAWSAYQPLHVLMMNEGWRDIAAGPTLMAMAGTEITAFNLPLASLTLFAYNLWVSLFYGGLLVGGYALSVRNERMRTTLREAALVRGRTEALLGELRLQTLRSQIDPALLLAGLDEVQRLYRDQPDRADDLLERLVDFLRAAMPGLKTRHSTLHAEVRLAAACAALQWRMPGGARWTIERPDALPEWPFPSMLLLPVLAGAQAGASPRLIVQWVEGKVVLTVQDVGRRLSADIEQRTRLRLHALLGERVRLRANDSPQTQLVVELEPAPAPTEMIHEPRFA